MPLTDAQAISYLRVPDEESAVEHDVEMPVEKVIPLYAFEIDDALRILERHRATGWIVISVAAC